MGSAEAGAGMGNMAASGREHLMAETSPRYDESINKSNDR